MGEVEEEFRGRGRECWMFNFEFLMRRRGRCNFLRGRDVLVPFN
jgi:hypothetical protein